MVLPDFKAQRLAVGLTQEQACARAWMRQGSWSRIETGARLASLVQLERMANALGCEIVLSLRPKESLQYLGPMVVVAHQVPPALDMR